MIESDSRPLDNASDFIEVPQVDPIGAGFTPLTESNVVGKRKIRPLKNQRPQDKIITAPISGDSLSADGIYDGDVAVLRLNFERWEIRPDRLVVVKCPAGVVIKYFSVTIDGRACLSSHNKQFPDLIFDLQEIDIQAVVVRIDRVVRDWS